MGRAAYQSIHRAKHTQRVKDMARIRTVKPEFWTSEQVAECSTITRLLFIGMWNFCDDGGNHPASLKSLKMQVFPSDDIQLSEIGTMIDELVKNELITQYTVNNKDYWHVLGWKHQKIEKPNYKHPEYFPTNSKPIDDHSSNDSLPVDPVMESKGMEGKGMDINNKNNASEDFQKQDESHLYVAPTRRTYSLFDEWKPEPELWKETLKRSAHLVKPEQFTKYTLLEFIRLNVGKDEKMESEWQKFYVNAVARGYIKPMTDKPKSQKQPELEVDYSKPQNLIVPVVYPYDPEERARQSAEMKRIRKEQGR